MADKQRKIKKLRKVHIWPSFLFFFFSIFMLAAAVAGIFGLNLTAKLTDQIYQTGRNADNYRQLISEKLAQGESVTDVLTFFEKGRYDMDALYVVDEDNRAVDGFGEFTCRADRPTAADETDSLVLYPDTNPITFLDQNMDVDGAKLFALGVRSWLLDDGNYRNPEYRYRTIDRAPYWIQIYVLPDGNRILMRCFFEYTLNDLFWAFVPAALAAGIMLISVLFLFINIIVNFTTQSRMTRLLFLDMATGGKNRFYFADRTGKILERRSNANKTYAVVDFSMAKYRSYCLFHGMRAGEELLEKTDRFFAKQIRTGECSAHTENANFALLLRCDNKENCEKRLAEWLRQLPEYIGHSHVIFHVGVCYVEPAGQFHSDKNKARRRQVDVLQLLNNASTARTLLNQSETSGIEVYGEKLLEEQMWEHRVEEMMDAALQNKEFQVYIQPKYNPVTEELAGGEALIRWLSPTDGFIGPGRFIPIFEKNGFITKIDDYMISHVAALQSEWLAQGKQVVPISVNVSRIHFAMPELAEHICELVDVYKTPHSLIEIELTESAFFDDKNTLLNTVRKLQEFEFEVSMDDFGSGYSSLNSLKDMPLDVLKLDAEFFRGEGEGKRGEIVVSEAIQLAKNLNMRIVAEGVEKKEQVEFLAGQGCDMIQGYYYAKPMPADEFALRM